MAAPCTICNHPDRVALDAALVEGKSYRAVARQWGASKDAVARHHRAHVSPALVRVGEKRLARAAEAGPRTALDRLEDLYARAVRVLVRVEATPNTAQQLAAINAAQKLVETIARVTGEIRPDGGVSVQLATVNVMASGEIAGLISVLMRTLAAWPEARVAVADALEALDVELPSRQLEGEV